MPFTKHSTEGRMCGLRKEVKYGQARSHGGGHSGAVSPKFPCSQKICFKNMIKTKILPP